MENPLGGGRLPTSRESIHGRKLFPPSMAQTKRIRLKYSAASLINARYEMGKEPSSYHDMEDRYFVENNEPHAMVFCVFDGHDGPNAVNFVSKKLKHIFRSKSWRTIISVLTVERNDTIVRALREFFMTVDKEYFDVRRDHIIEKQRLQRILGVSIKFAL